MRECARYLLEVEVFTVCGAMTYVGRTFEMLLKGTRSMVVEILRLFLTAIRLLECVLTMPC